MIISRTPLRISFAGGGSDIPSYYTRQRGCVVSTAIKKYIYIAVNKCFDDRIIVRYSKEEKVRNIAELEHNLIREALRIVDIHKGIDISATADVPSEGSGLGSSSSFVVGVLHALYAFKGQHVSAEKLARDACRIEIEILKKPIGKQDQYATAYGGFNYLQFNPDESVYIDPIICQFGTKERLEKNLLLLYTGITRSSDTILAKQSRNMREDSQMQNVMTQMVTIADEMRTSLRKNNLNTFGEFLDENWQLKKQMADTISSPKIDGWYAVAKKNGAIGGKLLGAGGGGFLLFYASQKYHRKIIKALPMLRPTEIAFEPQGSKIIFVGE